MLHLYSTESGNKEAVIKFTTESAASTACLLTNALVDGASLKIELYPSEEERESVPPRFAFSPSARSQDATSNGSAPSNDSFTSIFSGIASSSRALASSMASKVKAFDVQYKVSDTVISGATTAWEESKRLASDLDNKYHVSESVSSAVKTTKEKVMGAAGRGSPATGASPGDIPSNRSTSPSKFN